MWRGGPGKFAGTTFSIAASWPPVCGAPTRMPIWPPANANTGTASGVWTNGVLVAVAVMELLFVGSSSWRSVHDGERDAHRRRLGAVRGGGDRQAVAARLQGLAGQTTAERDAVGARAASRGDRSADALAALGGDGQRDLGRRRQREGHVRAGGLGGAPGDAERLRLERDL